jgi:hypothetical protein
LPFLITVLLPRDDADDLLSYRRAARMPDNVLEGEDSSREEAPLRFAPTTFGARQGFLRSLPNGKAA